MNFIIGLNSSIDQNDIKNKDENVNVNVNDFLTPEYFISVLLCLKSCKEFYNINFTSLNDITLSYQNNKNPKFILLSKGILQVKSDISPYIICSTKVNSIYRMEHFYSYDGLPIIFVYLLTLFYNKYKDNKRYYSSYIKPYLKVLESL